MNNQVSETILKGYRSRLVKSSFLGVIVSIIYIMIWAATLKGNEGGRNLGRPRTCGANVGVFMGGKRNIARETGLMGNVSDDMKGNKSMDLTQADWTLVRAKTI